MSQDMQIETLNYIAKEIYTYGYAVAIIAGLFGNTFIIIMFSTKFQKTVCSLYLIAGNLANNVSLLIYILPYFIYLTYGRNGTETWVSWCRLMNYIGDISLQISTYTICLTAIDRYLYTSRAINRRNMSSKKVAKITLIIVMLVSCIFPIPDLLYWYIDEDYHYCTAEPIYFTYVSYFFTPILLALIPLIILCVTGYKTYHNMRSNIHPATSNTGLEFQRRRIDIQVSQMILVQTFFLAIQSMSFSIMTLHNTITSKWVKSDMRLAVENVGIAVGYVIYCTFLWISFYIYYAQSQSFRGHVNKMLKIKI